MALNKLWREQSSVRQFTICQICDKRSRLNNDVRESSGFVGDSFMKIVEREGVKQLVQQCQPQSTRIRQRPCIETRCERKKKKKEKKKEKRIKSVNRSEIKQIKRTLRFTEMSCQTDRLTGAQAS